MAPAQDDWTAVVNKINCVEKLTFTLRLQYDQYVKHWKTLLHMMSAYM